MSIIDSGVTDLKKSTDLNKESLDYHAAYPAGKISINITKPTDSQKDLSLAYTPGVAEPVRAIAKNPEDAYKYTSKGNIVAVNMHINGMYHVSFNTESLANRLV